jgi:hypothetical protein
MPNRDELLDVSEFAKSVGLRRYRTRVDPVLLTVLGSIFGYECGDLEVLRKILVPLHIFMRVHKSALSFKFDIGPPNSDVLPIPVLVTYESGADGDYFAIRIHDAKLATHESWEAET